MWIERISLEGFGPFARLQTVEFGPRDVNLVVGPNETGKSALVSGLCAVLFGERPSAVLRLRSWHATDDARFRGVVELRTQDGRKVRLTRDFASETLSAAEVTDGAERLLFSGRMTPGTRRGSVVQPYESLLTEILGFSSRTIFEQTLCVRQTMLSTVFSGELREIASGSARANYVDVRTRLLDRCDEITRDRPPDSGQRRLTHDRALERALDRCRQLEREIAEAERWAKQVAELEAGRDRMAEAKERACRAAEAQREQIEIADRFARALERYVAARDEHTEQLHQLRSLHETLRNVESVERELEREFGDFRDVGDDFLITVGEFEALEGQVEEANARVSRLTDRLQERRARRRWLALGWFGSGLSVVVIGLMLLLTGVTPALFCGAVGIGCLACLCGAAAFWWTSGKVGEARARRDAAIEHRHSVETRYNRLLETYGRTIAGRSAETLRTHYRKYREKLNEHTQLLAQAQVSVGEETLSKRVAELDANHAVARTQLDEIRQEHPWVARWDDEIEQVEKFLEQARRSVADTEREVEELEAQLVEADKNLAVKVATSRRDLGRLEEERDNLGREIAELRRERDALYLAWRVLDESIDEFSRTAVERVCERASQLFETFTGGRYAQVYLTEQLEPLVESRLKTDIAPEELSVGACDQLYLALRIAFAEVLAGREGLPIILDDPFASFDSDRLDSAMRTLKLIAKERQVILLTHDQRVERAGVIVARLDREEHQQKS